MKIPQETIALLEHGHELYNRPSFIAPDPISVPHRFSKQQDIEISGLFSALFAWGQRKTAINKANELLRRMDNAPYDFILHSEDSDLKSLDGFVHRTFNSDDIIFFTAALKAMYREYNSMEDFFTPLFHKMNTAAVIHTFKIKMMQVEHLARSEKHLPDPLRGSTAKRINMFLRWMIRTDNKGVDFGLWTNIEPKLLRLPLDVHSGRMARKMGILTRKVNDWRAVEEVTSSLSLIDPWDPVRFDFALFGLGVYENF